MYENEEQRRDTQTGSRPHGSGTGVGGAATERKSPVMAGLLSLLPGLGQVYVGYYHRGFMHILVASGAILLLNMYEFRGLHSFLGVFLAFFWIYNVIDATRCAQAVNLGLESGLQADLPEMPGAIGGGGGVFAGSVLVVLGSLFLAHTVMGFSLAWIADWWPVALILFGVRMILTGRGRHRDRSGLE